MTTLICVIGPNAHTVLRRTADSAQNLTLESSNESRTDPIQQSGLLLEVWRRAGTHGSVYSAVPFDPLAVVVDHWARRLEGNAHDLEVMIGLVRDAPTPDYWIVSNTLSAPRVHWYYEHLPSLAKGRVLIQPLSEGGLHKTIGSLPPAPLPPGLTTIADSARDYVPSPVLGTTSEEHPSLVLPNGAPQEEATPPAVNSATA